MKEEIKLLVRLRGIDSLRIYFGLILQTQQFHTSKFRLRLILCKRIQKLNLLAVGSKLKDSQSLFLGESLIQSRLDYQAFKISVNGNCMLL